MIKCTGNHWVSKWICTQIKLGIEEDNLSQRDSSKFWRQGLEKYWKSEAIEGERTWEFVCGLRLITAGCENGSHLSPACYPQRRGTLGIFLEQSSSSYFHRQLNPYGVEGRLIATLFSVLSPWFCELASRYRRHRESNNSRRVIEGRTVSFFANSLFAVA